MFEIVKKVFLIQLSRGQSELNGKLNDKEIQKYCALDLQTQDILNSATSRFDLSQRSIKKVLKVARTIADIEADKNIEKKHLLEALSFRIK
jgi:magnesium chelatase family protein